MVGNRVAQQELQEREAADLRQMLNNVQYPTEISEVWVTLGQPSVQGPVSAR